MFIEFINNWSFFFTYFRHMFPSLHNKEFMIISNWSKKLEPALTAEFSNIISLYCCYYLGKNLIKFYSEDEVHNLF